jgi:[ribosomal protein S5]-alanine N-acetyltransferase
MESETNKLPFTLRHFQTGDEASLVENANNIKIFNNVRDVFPHPYTHDDATWWIEMNKQSENPATCFAIDVAGDAIGAVGIILGSDIYRVSAEIGYWLGENYWGKGIASEAVKLMVDYAFKNFAEVQRIWAGVFHHNKSSMRVLEKAGFHFEGIQKKSAIKNGHLLDVYMYVKYRD